MATTDARREGVRADGHYRIVVSRQATLRECLCRLEKKATRALQNDTRILCDDLFTVSGKRLTNDLADKALAQALRAFKYADMRMWDEGTRSWPQQIIWLRAAPQAGNDDSATTFTL